MWLKRVSDLEIRTHGLPHDTLVAYTSSFFIWAPLRHYFFLYVYDHALESVRADARPLHLRILYTGVETKYWNESVALLYSSFYA